LVNSRRKGKRGELEWAAALRAAGYTARRGQQYKGSPESPDVLCDDLPLPIHWEVKFTERLSVYQALGQATQDAGSGEWPVVAHRRKGAEWCCILPAELMLVLLRGYKRKGLES
jgi:Holliday junction resolvase